MIKNWFTILALALLPSAAALADTITITLDSPTLSGSAGDTLQFFGTLTNTTSDTVFLNDDNFNLASIPLGSIDDSPFFANAPLSLDAAGSLDGGFTSGDIELFDVTIPDPFPPGNYDGTFQVLGGADGGSQDIVGTADFTVQVLGPVSGVPEPGSLGLMAAALVGICAINRRRRNRA
ncbi:MAG TPA: PEP-CTERM sorting domain-containing protein [Bryobacteraceae bacterium]|nr:PEP-CTERM sorting domain-containing protein [Bryobacteraceae bacterium]